MDFRGDARMAQFGFDRAGWRRVQRSSRDGRREMSLMHRARRAWLANKGSTVARLVPAGAFSIGMRYRHSPATAIDCSPFDERAAAASVAATAQRQQALVEDGIFQPGRSNLPDGAAGSYALSPDAAEVIEIILNGTANSVRLQGYLTRMGDGLRIEARP